MARKHTARGNGQSPPIEGPPEKRRSLRREVTRQNNFCSIYTNDIQVSMSSWDIRLILGEIGDTSEADSNVVNIKQLGEVRMSLPIAKRLAAMLTGQIEAYEKQFGQIPGPKG